MQAFITRLSGLAYLWPCSGFSLESGFTNYLPDVEMIKKNGVRVFMTVGKISLDKKWWYAETAQILAEKLGCEIVTFPGYHFSYMDMPDEWAATLCSVLHSKCHLHIDIIHHWQHIQRKERYYDKSSSQNRDRPNNAGCY